jgi:hypothetical protein
MDSTADDLGRNDADLDEIWATHRKDVYSHDAKDKKKGLRGRLGLKKKGSQQKSSSGGGDRRANSSSRKNRSKSSRRNREDVGSVNSAWYEESSVRSRSLGGGSRKKNQDRKKVSISKYVERIELKERNRGGEKKSDRHQRGAGSDRHNQRRSDNYRKRPDYSYGEERDDDDGFESSFEEQQSSSKKSLTVPIKVKRTVSRSQLKQPKSGFPRSRSADASLSRNRSRSFDAGNNGRRNRSRSVDRLDRNKGRGGGRNNARSSSKERRGGGNRRRARSPSILRQRNPINDYDVFDDFDDDHYY